MSKIDVFGATGFIGSRFCNLYKDITYTHPRDNSYPDYTNILYLISTIDNYNVFTDRHIDINTNLNKLMDVIGYCNNTNEAVFNFVSSWFVYGDSPLPAKETSYCNPKGFYSITKRCAEQLLISYCETFHIKYRILRLGNVYGKGDSKFSKKKNALQFLINEIKENRDINLYFGGNFLRDYIHVDDACRAIKLCLEKAELNTIINISNGIGYNFRDLIEYVIKETKSSSKMHSIEQPDFHKIVQVKDMVLDTENLKKLGYKPQITIEEGLKSLL